MLKILIFILGVANALALKCHDCNNFDTASCFRIENSNNTKLKECKPNETRCALLIEKTTDPIITRRCVQPSWKCDNSKYKCATCETDGCNTGQDVPKPPINVNKAEVFNIIQANIYGISAIACLITLLLIWCVIRVRNKRKANKYEDEDDYDEYYENETNIDLDEPSDQKS
ncbi:uncharacterized protein LOC135952318 [Calliphora vicina]|uniref:uncharacterized protein LOC135952318 n=1 Tax=Calliphora vicina TaxID=7373 RepID=UPI00325AB1F4